MLLAPPAVGWFLPRGRLDEGWRPPIIPTFTTWPLAGPSLWKMTPSPVSHWPAGIAAASPPLPPGTFASLEALPGGDSRPRAAAGLVMGLRNHPQCREWAEQTEPSQPSGPVQHVPAPAVASAAPGASR